MENSADALKIAFAIFIFVIAITITFSLVSLVKSTTDSVVFYSDKTKYQTYTENSTEDRVVKISEIVSKIYTYYVESCCVKIDTNNNGEYEYVFDTYETKYSTMEELEKELNKMAKEITDSYGNCDFIEKFDEVVYSGSYYKGEDGTQVILASGGRKIYITYTKK